MFTIDETQGHVVYQTSDIDGDTLIVTRGEDGFAAWIHGEDGHRGVYLTAADVKSLVKALTGVV